MSEWRRWDEVEREAINPQFERQLISGERIMLARIFLRRGAVIPLHSHENEQISWVLEGSLRFSLEGREVVVAAGEVLTIPGGVPHAAVAIEDTVNLDVFSPPRADWLEKRDAYLRIPATR